MRTVNIGGREHTLTASPLTLLIYRSLEGRDIISDTLVLNQQAVLDKRFLDYTRALQLAWAMAKTTADGGAFPDFDTWIKSLDAGSLGDLTETVGEILAEAAEGFFRNAAGAAIKDVPGFD